VFQDEEDEQAPQSRCLEDTVHLAPPLRGAICLGSPDLRIAIAPPPGKVLAIVNPEYFI
jgi:hypothetical protein